MCVTPSKEYLTRFRYLYLITYHLKLIPSVVRYARQQNKTLWLMTQNRNKTVVLNIYIALNKREKAIAMFARCNVQ